MISTCHSSPRRYSPDERAGLAANERGAIMVIGVFMAIVLVGLLWYIAGVGTTLFHRERMQDAADAVALSTAIGHARGMNVIAFINIVMAALVAVVLALKVIEMMLTALALILAGISWFFPPAAAAIPVVKSARDVVAEIHNATRQVVDQVLVVLHLSEKAVQAITPAAAVGLAMTTVQSKYSDVADATFAIPPRINLPVEDDTYNRLCDEARDMLESLIRLATDKVPLIGKVIDMAMSGIIGAVTRYFCYQEGASPKHEIEVDRIYPFNGPGPQCEQDRANFRTDSAACTEWDKQNRDRRPNKEGDCDNATCEQNLANARAACNPATAGAQSYSFSKATVDETVEYDPATNTWKTVEFEYVPGSATFVNLQEFATAEDIINDPTTAPSLVGEMPPEPQREKPCDRGYLAQSRYEYGEDAYINTWSEWNTVMEVRSAPAHELPVCSMRRQAMQNLPPLPEAAPPPRGFNVGPHALRYQAVKHVYGCTKKANVTMEFPSDWQQARSGDGSDKSPQKMEEGVTLGGNDFQMRGVALSGGRPGLSERQLQVASFRGNTGPESWVEPARTLGNFSIAQAEYYYDHNGTESQDEWLWNMKWRARLVRFSLPGNDGGGQTQQAGASQTPDLSSFSLSAPNTDLGAIQGMLPAGSPNLNVLSDIVVH